MKRLLLAFGLLACWCVPAATQESPLRDSRRIPAHSPQELINSLLSASESEEAAKLKELGLCPGSKDVRLLYSNLDEDDDLEAIVACDALSYAKAIVLDLQDGKWYRIAAFSCGCKYEKEPLEAFLELRWAGTGFRHDILVRDSGGGTGIYIRYLGVFRIHQGEVHEILRIPEEEVRACPPSQPCSLKRTLLWRPYRPPGDERDVLVLNTLEGPLPGDRKGRGRIDPARENPAWWRYLKQSGCEAYSWNSSKYKFIADSEATAQHCK